MSETGDAGFTARCLLRAARHGTLATAAPPDGRPFASLVTPAALPDGSILLLLSDLAEHTRHLRADPRCALLVQGRATDANPQTRPRVTLTGTAAPAPEEPALRARFLAVHPYAALYAGFGDFHLWHIRVEDALLVAGFARATRLTAARWAPDPASVDAVAAAETRILDHCNADHADALEVIALDQGGAAGVWRMTAADADGCDLTAGETVLRIPWSRPAATPADIRRELVEMTARSRAAGTRPDAARKPSNR